MSSSSSLNLKSPLQFVLELASNGGGGGVDVKVLVAGLERAVAEGEIAIVVVVNLLQPAGRAQCLV